MAEVGRISKPKATEPQISVEERIEGLRNDSKALTRKEKLSAYFTIAAAAFGLISDGCRFSATAHRIAASADRRPDQNNLMTMSNVIFGKLYPKEYTSDVSTRVSNALLVGKLVIYSACASANGAKGAIIGQITVGLICDRISKREA